jgi:hypothetical protein
MTRNGDIVFFKKRSLFSRLIRFFTRSKDEPKTYASHVGGLHLRAFTRPHIIESSFEVIRRPFGLDGEGSLEIWSHKTITDEERAEVVAKANEYVGRTYGFFKLVTHFLDAIVVKLINKEFFFFRRLTNSDKYPICSWVWAYAYYKGYDNYEFGIDPKYATPDDMHDFVKQSDEWEMVKKQ